ncbi:wall-associated receptor kinase 2-like [Silene latifolia]|uniref:wall-associated receptor kinase 2-like n=1 Tax=Silene latifolia TaxID=37657 RepID=UPI003D76D454
MGYSNHVLVILINLVLTPLITADEEVSSLVIAPHCTSVCGNVTIPYPFGIEKGCYYEDKDDLVSNPSKKLICDHTMNPPKPILSSKNITISYISLEEGEILVDLNVSFKCFTKKGVPTESRIQSANLPNFTISSSKNKLVVIGCDTYAWFIGFHTGEPYYTGCMTRCDNLNMVIDNHCHGVGCCQTWVPEGVTNLTTTPESYDNHSYVGRFNPCSVAFPVAIDLFVFKKEDLSRKSDYYLDHPTRPVMFDWGIGTKNCTVAQAEGNCLCKNNTICKDNLQQSGYLCNCKDGYTGNPYLPQGCKDKDECKGENKCEKPEYCHNTDGSYFCHCPKGYDGKGEKTNVCRISNSKTWLIPVIITAGIGAVIITSLIIGFFMYRRRGERELKQLRKSYFRQNGGLILHQKISGIDILKIFTAKELENATDKYDEANIIGRGGFGVVYKGIILDNKQVAIKRSLKVDPNQVEQFINEVLVLSQINNRNVVKLLGCCLETEVPLLVYEFINNGTLYAHLHDEEKVPHLIWNLRLRIALEIADVLSYLHTTISTPIIHRDMKSMNVQSYTAKVADFGASKLVPLDQGQLATMVVGTQGYLDPEYMRSFELTEKSDVYSFGVVLVELLTKKKALSNQESELERCLALHFLSKMKQDRLFDIVDKNISNGPKEIEQIKKVANLAKLCLRLKRERRPTMKEVAMELEGIKKMGSNVNHSVGQSFDELENFGDHLVEFPTVDDGSNGGRDSDIHTLLQNGR